MKKIILIVVAIVLCSCNEKKETIPLETSINKIVGTWKLFYGEIKENDSVQVKDLSNTDFIKIINKEQNS